jgi:DNA-directed RNA polymerase specialized sigma24 family protein
MPPPPPAQPHDDAQRPLNDLIAASYPALRRMAAARVGGSGVSPSSLANDTVCRLLKLPTPPADGDALSGIAHQLMEWGLVDRLRQGARRRKHEDASGKDHRPLQISGGISLSFSRHFSALAAASPRKAEAMLLWAVHGCTMRQIASMLGVSEKTVQRDIAFATTWLIDAARGGDA